MKIRWGIRLLLLASAAGYLAFMIASHGVPLSPGLEGPLAFAGWLPFAAFIVTEFIRANASGRPVERYPLRHYLAPLRGRRDIRVFIAIMLVVLAAAAAESAEGNRPDACASSHDPATCVKVDQWAEKDGRYLRRYPYDAAGDDDPNAPWVRISRAEYVAEVGTKLRSAAGFGVLALALATFLSVLEEGLSLSRRPREGEIRLAGELPQPDWRP